MAHATYPWTGGDRILVIAHQAKGLRALHFDDRSPVTSGTGKLLSGSPQQCQSGCFSVHPFCCDGASLFLALRTVARAQLLFSGLSCLWALRGGDSPV